jgi:hypothetical protein
MLMPAPEIVRQLVQRFEENLDSYRSGRYNETQLRREFLDPLFEALGWDVFNRQGYAEAYKDVIHEDSLDIELLPIRPINFSDPAEKAMHDKMVSLVERMLELHKRSPRTPQEQEMVKREIESTDVRIDRLVYELYGLTEDEIKIVEGKE